jgi:D-glycero-alpha-D-manno-heptose 1-phosphate guanylyltransferase
MAPICGRPFLEWIVLGLASRGVDRAVLATGYLAHDIKNHFQNGRFGVSLTYSREDQLMGTAGSTRIAGAMAAGNPLLVLNGDSYCGFDLPAMLNAHYTTGALATISLHKVENSDRFGSVAIGTQGEILGFREKSGAGPGLINSGVYLLARECLARIPPGRNMSLETQIFPDMVGRGLYGLAGNGPFLDIGTPDAFKVAASVLGAEFDCLEALNNATVEI